MPDYRKLFDVVTIYTTNMTFVRKIKSGKRVYYAEVKNERVGKKVVQHYIRYIGTDTNAPKRRFEIEKVHFGYVAQLILGDALTPQDIFRMLENKGEVITEMELEKLGIEYQFAKKTLFISLYPRMEKKRRRKPARSARRSTASTRRTRGAWSHFTVKQPSG